jgi:hypothetical protein
MRGVFVPDAADVMVQNVDEVLSLLWHGARNRAISETDMNAYSSRSHTIFQVCFAIYFFVSFLLVLCVFLYV